MRVQEHAKLSVAVATVALPWLKKDVWIPLASSVLIDVDHYLWHAMTHRTLSLRAAVRYFGQANTPQLPQARLLHHPIVLGILLVVAARTRSRVLWLILGGLLFHVSLDLVHAAQMKSLKRTLSEKAQYICPECGKHDEELQIHTVHFASNLFDRYNPCHFVVLCPACHEKAHSEGERLNLTRISPSATSFFFERYGAWASPPSGPLERATESPFRLSPKLKRHAPRRMTFQINMGNETSTEKMKL